MLDLMITILVDDVLLMVKEFMILSKAKVTPYKRFEMEDMGMIKWFFIINVNRRKERAHVPQTEYVDDILESFHLGDSKPKPVPFPQLVFDSVKKLKTNLGLYRKNSKEHFNNLLILFVNWCA